MRLYYLNLLILCLLENIKTIDIEKSPVYIHFVNSETNNIPSFLSNKKEVCIVLQRQFEDLEIDYRYLNVTLSINDVKYRLNIDLSTIFILDIVGITRVEFEKRLSDDYLLEINSINSDEYIENMKISVVQHGQMLKDVTVGLIPKVLQENDSSEDKAKIISIDDAIKVKK